VPRDCSPPSNRHGLAALPSWVTRPLSLSALLAAALGCLEWTAVTDWLGSLDQRLVATLNHELTPYEEDDLGKPAR